MIRNSMLFFISLSLTVQFGYAQNTRLEFTTKFYDAIDEWVVFEGNDADSKPSVGFIYLDEEAGPTFFYQGTLINFPSDMTIANVLKDATIRHRLEANTADVAVLSEAQVKALGLKRYPDWLTAYKGNKDTDAYEISRGRWLNAVGASHRALPILQAIYQKDPHTEGLEFELAFAYNATKSFYKAVVVLNEAIKHDPNNFWYYRELGYAYKYLNNIKEAENMYTKGISLTKNKYQQAEMAVNMLQGYFHIMDKNKYEEWKNQLYLYAEPGSVFIEYIKWFDENWGKQGTVVN